MKKWILIGVAAMIVISAALLVLLISNLGPMIKKAVNTYGPTITKTDLSLEDVNISIFSAEAKLENLFLGNPKGFQSPHAVKVGSVFVDVNEKSILGDTIIIEKIEVIAPEIAYEKISGSDNFRTILNNINQTVKTEKSAGKTSDPQKDSAGKKMIIRNFILNQGKANLILTEPVGMTVAAALPDIHLKDIGQSSGGTSPAEAFNEIFTALYATISSTQVNALFEQGLKDLGVKKVDEMEQQASREIEKATKDLPAPVGQEANKVMQDAAGKLKGMFGN